MTASPAALAAPEETVDGPATAIRRVVSGQTCAGDDVLIFGESGLGSAETFERKGRPNGTYAIGYGTILIRPDIGRSRFSCTPCNIYPVWVYGPHATRHDKT